MNNKGQTLVIFIILLPFICILFGYIFDSCYVMYQKKELKNIATIVCQYALNDNKPEDEIRQLALENDKDIENIKITKTDNEAKIVLEKSQKSIFSKLLGKDYYFIKANTSCIEIEE